MEGQQHFFNLKFDLKLKNDEMLHVEHLQHLRIIENWLEPHWAPNACIKKQIPTHFWRQRGSTDFDIACQHTCPARMRPWTLICLEMPCHNLDRFLWIFPECVILCHGVLHPSLSQHLHPYQYWCPSWNHLIHQWCQSPNDQVEIEEIGMSYQDPG